MSQLEQKGCRVYIVPETHWDRAWYLPFEQFRRKLVQLMDRLTGELARNGEFTCFVADGQTVVMEDYLQIRPEKRPQIEALIKAGRLKIGPWYVLPDEFIVSGESLVRNLAIGQRMAEGLGGRMKVGYVPDPFGHVAQLPQILRGFGLDNFIFHRGVLSEQTDVEFLWEAPDGSSVLAIHQRHCYNNAAFLGYPISWGEPERMEFRMEEAMAQIEKAVEGLAERSLTHVYLLNNGIDHAEHQPELPRVLEEARRRWPLAEIQIAGFDDYIGAVRRELDGRELAVKKHELSFPLGNLLKGVYSARVYLKQANQRCETLLCSFAEPLEAMASLSGNQRMDERATMDYAWRELIKCHPHDDICGCSVDSVHRDMMNRFERVEQIGWAVAGEALRDIANAMDHSGREGAAMVLYNPTARPRLGAQRVLLLFELGEEALKESRFRIVDAAGRELPFEIIRSQKMTWMEIRKQFDLQVVEVLLDAGAIPPCGFKSIYVQPAEAAKAPKQPARVKTSAHGLENEYLKVQVAPDGSYTLTDKAGGAVYKGLGLLEESEDCGDEYNWSDLEGSRAITSAGGQAEIEAAAQGGLGGTLTIRQRLLVPISLKADRQGRSPLKIELPVTTELSLRAGSRRLEVKTTVDNRAQDHRLRVLFPTPFKSEMVQAGGHFDTVERPVDPKRQPQYLEKYQAALYPTEHFAGFVRLGDERQGLAVLARGLCEYEAIEGQGKAGHTLALTLFRSVGWLSRGDFRCRPGNAGPQIATPEAQMPGLHCFEYALYPHGGEWAKAQLAQEAQELSQPVMSERGDRHNTSIPEDQPGRVRPVPREGTLPETFSIVAIEPAELALTALKLSDSEKEWIVRFYNQAPYAVKAVVEFGFPAKAVRLADLNEKAAGGKPIGQGTRVELGVGAKKIVTLAVRF